MFKKQKYADGSRMYILLTQKDVLVYTPQHFPGVWVQAYSKKRQILMYNYSRNYLHQ